jgi:hypothetical protein
MRLSRVVRSKLEKKLWYSFFILTLMFFSIRRSLKVVPNLT